MEDVDTSKVLDQLAHSFEDKFSCWKGELMAKVSAMDQILVLKLGSATLELSFNGDHSKTLSFRIQRWKVT